MKKNDKRQLDDNFIEQKIADAFGYTDEKLAAELDRFMAEAASERGQRPPEAPEEEFRKILDIVEREKDSQKKKGLRVRRLVKVIAAAAALGSMVLGGGMWVGARKTRVYEERGHSVLENVVIFNNNWDNQIISEDLDVEKAYVQIEEALDMQVMELSYLPEEMSFYKYDLKKRKSVISFTNGIQSLFFYQGKNENTSSFSYISDMEAFEVVYNSYLDKEIPIYVESLEDNTTEFSLRIFNDNQYYILQGNIDEEEFIRIVKGIKYKN